jgi:hypothetical protein
VACGEADRQQDRVGRLALAALGAVTRIGVGVIRVEMRDDGVLKRDNLGFGATKASDLHDPGDLGLERLALRRQGWRRRIKKIIKPHCSRPGKRIINALGLWKVEKIIEPRCPRARRRTIVVALDFS